MVNFTALIDAYANGVRSVRQAVAGMSREQLLARPIAGKWSTLEVLCHLTDSDQAWAHRLKRVIAEEKPLLIGYDEARFAAALAYHQRDAAEELEYLDRTRQQMTRILRAVPASAWTRSGVHSEYGLMTLEKMLEIEIEHITHHLEHVAEKRQALGLEGRNLA